MALLFLAMSVAAALWHAAAPEPWQFSRAFLPNKAQYFALGAASALALREQRNGWRAYSAALAATLGLCVVQGGADKLLPPLIWTACLAAQAASGAQAPRYRAMVAVAIVLQSRPLVWLGAVSYCIYLVNEPVQKLLGVVLALLVNGDAALFTALWIPSAVALPILASWGLHVWIERPAQRCGRVIALAARSSSSAASAPRAAPLPRSGSAATQAAVR
jgi:peptidoglycan/LPS O-acetylase OafA/YrhL